jgi:NRAMP (natural resistance-associated macrophage protein)-like metal ion transporter
MREVPPQTSEQRTARRPTLRRRPGVPAPGVPPVLDEAHIGDIRGALGTIRQHDMDERRSIRARLLALLAIMGPGLIVMVGDNDAGGVATYLQAGQDYGVTLLWTLLLLIPVLIVNQEMVIRLGAVTGVGHARLINERFGRFWGWFSVGDLFLLNFLTIVTEFIGVSLALGYFGLSKYVAVPIAAGALIMITASGGFRSWERSMYVFVVANFLVIPLFFFAHPHAGPILHHLFVPGVAGGLSSTSILLIIAIVGTTVAPWQLFFQQSNIVDKRITPRWINYERTDTVIGAFVVVVAAAAIVCVAAFGLGGTTAHGGFVNAASTAHQLDGTIGSSAGTLLAIVLLNASLIGAAAVTLSTSYAFGDVFGMAHSLHRRPREARFFYASFAALVACAAGVVLVPGAPLGLITESVQALAGVLLPSATVFLLLLCNDREVLGPWVNPPWLNAIAALIVTWLVGLSLILVATTAYPHVNVSRLLLVISGTLTFGLVVVGLVTLRRQPEGAPRRGGRRGLPRGLLLALRGGPATVAPSERRTWTMPPLALLKPARWSPARKAAMLMLRVYLLAAVALMVVKAVQLGL